jgi:hypothetical protein
MFDLISVRGTKLTYELFFNALGYITTFEEFWYDNDGNLIGVEDAKYSKTDAISAADIRSELFDGDNIVIGQSDYGRSELVSGPFALKKEEEDSMERVD